MRPQSGYNRARALYALAVIAIIAFGLWMRGRDLAFTPVNGDEGESSINALTILQTGFPRGTYLGLPIYENCLTEPWPDHPEYEFRDSSYSSKDMAIYHGWLPLYSIAMSQKLFGVTPDEVLPAGEAQRIRHTDEEIRTRVTAARAPAVVFGLVFMIFCFLLGRELFGRDAALAALTVAAIGRPFVYFAREARYHSATLALTTASCYAVWRVYRYNRWADYLLTAVVLTLLFYTHLLAFMIASVMFGITSLIVLRRAVTKEAIAKIASVGLIGGACAAPWILFSGFLDQTSHIPPARAYLSFPADLVYYPILRIPYLILPTLGVVWLAVVYIFRHRLPERIVKPLALRRRQIVFLLAWISIGILAFTLLIPAASYFYKRLTLAVMGPGVVWGAILCAAATRAWKPRWSLVLAPAAFAAAVTLGMMSHLWFLEERFPTEAYDMIARLRAEKFTPDTKLYCTPNQQLALTYLTGLPVQSVAPVRKQFLDTYAGPIVLIDSAEPYEIVSAQEIKEIADDAGFAIGMAEARRLEGPMTTWLRRQELPGMVASVGPPMVGPPWADSVATYQKRITTKSLSKFYQKGSNNPLLRAYHLKDWSDWWPVFFYRFVDPEKRMHEKLNYVDRIKSADAEVLDSGWVLFRCPPLTMARTTSASQHVSNLNGSAPAMAR